MQIRYYGDKLSKRIAKTPEGFLICQDVPISRTGYQEYLASEIMENPRNGNKIIHVYRPAEEVFNFKSIASFEGKPVTNEHPDEDVTPENYQQYACGHVQNVHPGEGQDSNKVLADLYITDPSLINSILNGKREISCGYYAEEKRDASGKLCQTKIRGNHVAVVNSGRAGSNVCIRDHKRPSRHSYEDNFDMNHNDYGVKGMKYGGPGKAKPRGKPFGKGNPYRFGQDSDESDNLFDSEDYNKQGDSDMYDEDIMDEEMLDEDTYVEDLEDDDEELIGDDLTAEDLFEDEDEIVDEDFEDEDELMDEDLENDDDEMMDEDIMDEDEFVDDDELIGDDELSAEDLFEDDDEVIDDDEELMGEDLEDDDELMDEDIMDEDELIGDDLTAEDLFEDEDEIVDDDEDLIGDDLTAEDLFEDDDDIMDEDVIDECHDDDDELMDEDLEDDDDELTDECHDDDEEMMDEDLEDEDVIDCDDDDEEMMDEDLEDDDDEILSDDDEVDVTPTDEVEEKMAEGESTLDTKRDAAIREIVNATREITDPVQRKKLQDTIYHALCGKSQMKDIMRITQKNARAKHDSIITKKNKISMANQQAIYDSFNPHKVK